MGLEGPERYGGRGGEAAVQAARIHLTWCWKPLLGCLVRGRRRATEESGQGSRSTASGALGCRPEIVDFGIWADYRS